MTRDEHRAKCIEVMARTWLKRRGYDIDSGDNPSLAWILRQTIDELVEVFDALPTAGVRVVPIEATREMIDAASKTKRPWADCFELMAAAGDLTNDPEAGLPTAADVRGILKPEGKP